MELWDKQEGETPKAFTAFTRYLTLKDRSLAKLDKALLRDAEREPSKSSPKLAQLKVWSRHNDWVARAAAYDEHLALEALAIFESKQLKRRVDLQDAEWDASQALLARAQEINKLPVTEREVTDEVIRNGQVVTQFITIKPIRAAARDAARFVEMASKLGRLSTGLETDRIKVKMEVQAQLEELLGELRTTLSPAALAEIETYLFARTGERPEE